VKTFLKRKRLKRESRGGRGGKEKKKFTQLLPPQGSWNALIYEKNPQKEEEEPNLYKRAGGYCHEEDHKNWENQTA